MISLFVRAFTQTQHRASQQPRQRGFSTTEFLLGTALLILPTTLFVLSFPGWYDTSTMARAGAKEAARVYAVTGDEAAARQAAQSTMTSFKPEKTVEVSFSGDPNVAGSEVTATVTTEIDVLSIPTWGIESFSFTINRTQTEAIDLYRSVPA